ncbi:short-chain dehydrogenase [Geodermatophilus sp. TF02-6]|uniref:SDR family oxidoreductase n=1 Tax=Geodermatophilus sp. TF02-6 TaxID=2250575 RepID=UPI000DE919AF|nr:SDR family oxidoreductase [Geodermatophilus sp. TF02-6]RBY80916.1 short-chain dehydrogenase [Geodermatophilus sp. TF02-6]
MAGTVLVAGASGLVGAACVDRFLADGWDVVAVSRRRPEVDSDRPFEHLAVDLRDEAATRTAVAGLAGVTHLVYAAVYEKPGLIPGWTEQDQMDTNLAMLRNLLEPLTGVAALRHVTLLQGTKAYGIHLHPMRVPARERQPRDEHANFYWLQEDHLTDEAAGRFDWTIMRPQLVVGPNTGVVMNLPPVIGAFAAICRAEGRPFGFPGGVPYVWEAVDTRLVADAIRWAAEAPAAAGRHFNLTNGEVFEWRDLWPALADALGVPAGPDEPLSLAEFLPAKADVWDGVVAEHGLRPIAMADLLGESHHYADFCFAYGATQPPPPAFVSTVEIKQAGFCGVMDTEESFVHWIRVLQDRRVLPPAR